MLEARPTDSRDPATSSPRLVSVEKPKPEPDAVVERIDGMTRSTGRRSWWLYGIRPMTSGRRRADDARLPAVLPSRWAQFGEHRGNPCWSLAPSVRSQCETPCFFEGNRICPRSSVDRATVS